MSPAVAPPETTKTTPKIPFSVVRQVYQRWAQGLLRDSTVKEIYGQRWLEAFGMLKEHGVLLSKPWLSAMVEWDEEDLSDKCGECTRDNAGRS